MAAVVRGVWAGGVGTGEELQWGERPRDFHWLLPDWEASAGACSAAAVEVLVHAEQVERVVLLEAQRRVMARGLVVDLEGCLLSAVEERGMLQIVVGRCLDEVVALSGCMASSGGLLSTSHLASIVTFGRRAAVRI